MTSAIPFGGMRFTLSTFHGRAGEQKKKHMDEIFMRILTRTGQYALMIMLFLCLFIRGPLPQIPLLADFSRYIVENEVKEGLADIGPAPELKSYDELIAWTARKYNVDCALVKAVIKAESNFDHKAVSRKGAKGLMQLMPQTASLLRVNDCFRPEDNIDGGIRHLSYLISLYNGDLALALAAYNAGETAVARYRGIPPYADTRAYVRRVLHNYKRYKQEAMAVMVTAKQELIEPTSKQRAVINYPLPGSEIISCQKSY